MADARDSAQLSGKLLLAMPGMGDPRFDRAVIYLCAHSEDGAMGLIINKPAPDLNLSALLEQLKIEPPQEAATIRVHFGGPVENGRGFVLHSADYAVEDSTLKVDERFGMTATLDILRDIAHGAGPEASLMALGYAGWGPGQLEAEIKANGWLVCDASPEIVFDENDQIKWGAALATLGVDPRLLSASSGHA